MTTTEPPRDALREYAHLRDGGSASLLPVSPVFWDEVAAGAHPQLDEGRLLSAFAFSEPWSMWERHPAGEELVMLLSGAADVFVEDGSGERIVRLRNAGEYVLIPKGAWHTAQTTVPTKMLFVTPGAGTEHRPLRSPR
jgi:mannose-6-phosphate isomerase-like protein (cupin superfamily)